MFPYNCGKKLLYNHKSLSLDYKLHYWEKKKKSIQSTCLRGETSIQNIIVVILSALMDNSSSCSLQEHPQTGSNYLYSSFWQLISKLVCWLIVILRRYAGGPWRTDWFYGISFLWSFRTVYCINIQMQAYTTFPLALFTLLLKTELYTRSWLAEWVNGWSTDQCH